MEVVLALVAGIAVFLLIVGLVAPRRAGVLQARLGGLSTSRPDTLEELDLQQPLFDRTIRPLVDRLASVGQRLTSPASVNRTEQRIASAGYPAGLRAVDFLGVKALTAIVVGLSTFSVIAIAGRSPLIGAIATAAAVGVGWLIPEFWLGGRIARRQRLILRELPDTIDLLTISVRAGLGFDGAMAKVVEKGKGPLADEINRALAEIRVGKSRRDALHDMAGRARVEPLSTFVGAVVQADQLGVSISKVLQIQSEQLRIERRQRAEELAAKAPVKMLFPLVGCIFPAMFIVILGPAIIVLMRDLGRV